MMNERQFLQFIIHTSSFIKFSGSIGGNSIQGVKLPKILPEIAADTKFQCKRA
jgi:hypothetical protein